MREWLAEANPAALLADGLEDAIIGVTENHHHPIVAVYDFDRCREILMDRDGMDWEGAEEFLSFNTLGAWVGENGPLFVRLCKNCRSTRQPVSLRTHARKKCRKPLPR